ncbi:MAG: tRNA (adenosine(37)-N6)-threonylcarbamoyltransferase complex dimerization subunit type 1 TsaB [Deltaproteobacteria bacterium]|jgi:tRNA threonylcarbamoyladenosine biosynthesis protein TsaB|nr:tRNA (adenosine(37)-N6)-threonylcarbamoyltransferase complex dimerization subunit type 1 TsaB [Deltaproteobacteria bacterium]MBT4526818.1 tRNA (adenosine(37)-N6)-threonylcarbamoyltransferase complex dimerization subunit type 1 TsaB [Deltaproteobacteria bacterium]
MLIKEQCILGIEGTGHSISVGIMDQGIVKGCVFINAGLPGSSVLLKSIDELLKTCQIDKEKLNGICVTLGPGSFTSMRISLAVAESIGLALNIPLYGTDVLTLMAATVPFYEFSIKVIKNAYKGELYLAEFHIASGKVVQDSDLVLIKPELFFENLQENDLLLGDGVLKMQVDGYDLQSKNVCLDLSFGRQVSGIHVIEHFLEKEVAEPSIVPLEPIYIRLSEAEINYGKQFGKS